MQFKHGKIKFGYRDSYGKEVLEVIIHDWLVNFRDTLIKHRNEPVLLGVPLLNEGHAPSSDIHSLEGGEEHFQAWIEIINKMIFAFSGYEPEYLGGFTEGVEHGTRTDKGLIVHSMHPTDTNLWERYREEFKDVESDKIEGRKLFAEYFENLWW